MKYLIVIEVSMLSLVSLLLGNDLPMSIIGLSDFLFSGRREKIEFPFSYNIVWHLKI